MPPRVSSSRPTFTTVCALAPQPRPALGAQRWRNRTFRALHAPPLSVTTRRDQRLPGRHQVPQAEPAGAGDCADGGVQKEPDLNVPDQQGRRLRLQHPGARAKHHGQAQDAHPFCRHDGGGGRLRRPPDVALSKRWQDRAHPGLDLQVRGEPGLRHRARLPRADAVPQGDR